MGPKTIRCEFLGYSQANNVYHFLDLNSNVITELLDVNLFEDKFVVEKKSLELENNENVDEPEEPSTSEFVVEAAGPKIERSK